MLKFEEMPEVNSERWLSLEDLPGEVWKDIEGYEGKYQISWYGRFKALSQKRPHLGKFRVTKEKICKACFDKATGYYKHALYLDSKPVTHLVHRMVAAAFLPNPFNLGYINHKDENKRNNHVENLEWCTNKYNLEYSNVHEKQMKIFRRVVEVDSNGNILNEFSNTGEASRYVGVNITSMRRWCKGYTNCTTQSSWFYKDEYLNLRR